jgi:RimJ/RimL family protein N-acetyltransferase
MDIRLDVASINDCYDLYLIRNNDLVKKHLFSRASIAYEDHQGWFKNKLVANHNFLYVIRNCIDDKTLGSVRFDCISSVIYEISILILPEFQGVGVGKKSILLGLNCLSKMMSGCKVVAKVLPDNKASSALFLSCGFKPAGASKNNLSYDYRL